MKRIYLFTLITIVLCSTHSIAQNVGINSTGAAPDASAGLDVSYTDKGLLAPRVALTAANAAGPITSPATSLIVYNTASAGTGQNVVWPGYYYNAGTAAAPLWVRFDGRMTFHAASTSALTVTGLGTTAVVPGTGVTFTIPTGKSADVYIYAYTGLSLTGGTGTAWSLANVLLCRGGTFLPIGGYNRVKLNNGDGTSVDMRTTSFVCKETLAAGTYTYDIRGGLNSGNQITNIGANCATEVGCAEITVDVIFK
ncbi:MAG: hypothetical protein K0S33_2647 [Bacteroidetes bacterium]|jgi:hypothetical protein|nr:hypothetical protein [Bacteroidota bacterium]